MSIVLGRSTLPSEFYDRVSKIIAKQPLPEFTYARIAYLSNMSAELGRIGPEEFRGVFTGAMKDGGEAYPELTTMQLMLNGDRTTAMASAIMTADEIATGPGHTIRIPRPVFSGGGYTFAARRIGPGQTVSTTPIGVTDQEVSITVERHMGPYASGGTAVQPFAVSEAEARRSVHSLVQRAVRGLQYDRNAMLDAGLAALFDNWSTVIYPGDPAGALNSSGTTGDAAAFTNPGNRPFSLEGLKRAATILKIANIPRFADGTYKSIITPKQAEQLELDPLWVKASSMHKENNPLFMNYIGRVGDLEVFSSNSNTVDTTTVSGSTINHAVVFGPESVGYASTAEGCHVRQSSQTNYDQEALIVWVCDEGATQLNNTFGVGIHSN